MATSANSGRPVGWPSRLTKARLHFVTGKGGTGKSTIAASLALALAAGGRKVLELRPTGGGGKDAAVASLLASDGVVRAVYAGDDRTDLDAFRRLRELREGGELASAVCIGIVSVEAPAELAEESDLTVEGPGGWLEVLEWLAA